MSWALCNLESLAEDSQYSFVGGPFGSKLTTRDYVDEGVPVIRGGNLGNGRFLDTRDFVYVTEAKVREDLFGNLAKPGDLIFTQRGTLGQVALVPEDGPSDRYVVSQSQMKMTVDEEKADRLFLYYYFTSREAVQRIVSYVSSSGVPHINLTVLRDFEVPRPPLQTQHAIASILSAYDDLIENNRRRIQLLEQAARLLYKEWFVHLRFPGHEHVKIKDGLPEGWDKKSLGELIEIKRGKNITQVSTQEGTVPVVAGGLEPAYYHNEANVVGPVVTISASGANAGFVRIYHKDIWASDCSYISLDSTKHLYYYYCLLSSRQQEILGLQKGAAQPHVYPKDLMRITAVRPPDKILQYFDDAVAPLFALVKILGKQNNSLAASRDLLLPRLMNGEIAV